MDTVNSLTTESAIRKIVMAGISIFSFWWFSKHGTNPDPWLDEHHHRDAAARAVDADRRCHRYCVESIRQKQQALATKVAQNSPVVLSDLQLAATVQLVKDKKDELPHLTTEEAVAVVNSDKGII